MRVELRRAAAHDLCDLGVRPDDRDLPRRRRRAAGAPSFFRSTAPSAPARRISARCSGRSSARSGRRPGVAQRAGALPSAAARSAARPHGRPRRSPRPRPRRPASRPRSRGGPGISRSQPGIDRRRRRMRAEPVRHHHAVEAPFVAQHLGQQPADARRYRCRSACCRRTSPPRSRPRFTAASKGRQIDLAQRPLVDLRAHRRALDLALVADEVLRRGRDAPACSPRTWRPQVRAVSTGSSE